MSIIQYTWAFNGVEFTSRISRLHRCGSSRFAENCVTYAGELLDSSTGWEQAVSNIGGWDKSSINKEFADVETDSLDLALLIVVLASCKNAVDATDFDSSIRVSLSELAGEKCRSSAAILQSWRPPSTASNSFVVLNDKLIDWLETNGVKPGARVLQAAAEGDDLLCISSG